MPAEEVQQQTIETKQIVDNPQFISDMIRVWAELKTKILNGFDLELECKFNNNMPGTMHICIWNTYELNHYWDSENETLEVVNPQYAFSLSRQSSSSSWVLSNIYDDPNKAHTHRQFTHGLLTSSTLAFGALIIEESWISDLFNSDSLEIISIDKTEEKNLIQINFRCQHNLDQNNKLLNGTILFDSNNFWLPVDYDLTIELSYNTTASPNKNIRKIYRVEKHYSYQDNNEVSFFPKTVETIYFHEGRAPIRNKIEYISLKLGKPNKAMFYLRHYGFSEPASAANSGVLVFRIICIGIGIILILISLYMKFLANKMK
jgi:hypothetical protein